MEKNHKTVKQAQRGGAARSARRAHNPKVEGSNPSPAKKIKHYFFKSWKINPKKTTNGEKRRLRPGRGAKTCFFIRKDTNFCVLGLKTAGAGLPPPDGNGKPGSPLHIWLQNNKKTTGAEKHQKNKKTNASQKPRKKTKNN